MDLELANITVRFGGLTAVDDVSLVARSGEVTGLIGPNGAGKTTTFNATTGVVPVSAGSVKLGGKRIDGLSTAARAELGLGRTFQRMELFDSMTVRENVALGPEMRQAGRSAWTHLWAPAAERRAVRERTEDALAVCGLRAVGDLRTGDLSTGQRRLVELARAWASRFDLLLLDEPSSGLDPLETGRFIEVLQAMVATHGTGLLVVEHDIALVRELCTSLYVLDFGKLIAAAGVCHVPEGRGIFPGLTVEENLRLHAPRKVAVAERQRVVTAFPRLGERLAQRAGSLSGGEQQMLALAHAYTGTHRAVLLDEVSMGLAPRIVDEIFDHLKVLAASGTSLLLVEQYVKRALELADYVYVLRRGQIEFAGEPWQLGTDAILSSYLGESS
jgi:ABC-type branched-subunit amino acid transport system ATPase component